MPLCAKRHNTKNTILAKHEEQFLIFARCQQGYNNPLGVILLAGVWRDRYSIPTITIIIFVIVIIVITIITITIIITRPKPAFGRQGLGGVSLRASGAQLGRGMWSFFVTHKHCIIIYIYICITIIVINLPHLRKKTPFSRFVFLGISFFSIKSFPGLVCKRVSPFDVITRGIQQLFSVYY